jgi:hypothetical protein
VGFVVLKAGVTKAEDVIVKEVIQMVRDRIGPVAAFKTATVVKRLPKTRSGKDPARDDPEVSPTTRITTCRPPSTIRPFWVKWKRR